MTLGGYTYQVGDLFTTSKTGITGRIEKFVPQTKNVRLNFLRKSLESLHPKHDVKLL